MKDFPSNRKYTLTFIEGDAVVNQWPTLAEILNTEGENDYEWKYAIQEDFDSILDMKVGDHRRMQFNRDNFDSQGVIKRIA